MEEKSAEALKRSSLGLRQLPKLSAKDLAPAPGDGEGGTTLMEAVATGIRAVKSFNQMPGREQGKGRGGKKAATAEMKEGDAGGHVQMAQRGRPLLGSGGASSFHVDRAEEGFAEDHFADLEFEVDFTSCDVEQPEQPSAHGGLDEPGNDVENGGGGPDAIVGTGSGNAKRRKKGAKVYRQFSDEELITGVMRRLKVI